MDKLALTLESGIYLWGLLTLTIPIAIHLLSKHKGKIVPFAHIALITVKNSPQLNQARLTQWLLLIIRLLMLLVACGILAQLLWNKNANTSADIVLVSNDWLTQSSDAEKQQLFESLNANQSPRLFLIDGLNQSLSQRKLESKAVLAFQGGTSSTTTPLNIWANLAEITKALPKSQKIQFYTTNRLNQFTGQKVTLDNPIDWHIKFLPNTSSEPKLAASLAIISDANHQQQLAYIRGALNALTATLPVDIKVEYIDFSALANDLDLAAQQSHIIYLVDTPLPTELDNGAITILNSNQLQDYTQVDFPLILATQLFASQTKQWFSDNARLSNYQITELPTIDLLERQQTSVENGQPLHIWLVLILVILFVVERLVSEWPSKHTAQVEGN
ncbi:MAG: BatA domain-containing protein [Paraglaciecola sp.]|uniref:BatA domain-containing protein n=1 Tax=Paraglaciecola sp. TaxID=1920173 RepID=UPI00326315D4